MTITIPAWMLWALGASVGAIILLLAAYGVCCIAAIRKWRKEI